MVTTTINIHLPVDRVIKDLQDDTHCVSKSESEIYFAISKSDRTSTLSIFTVFGTLGS